MVSMNRLQSNWKSTRGHESTHLPTIEGIKQSAQSTFDDCPVGMVFAAFGLGLTLGMALSLLFKEEEKSSRIWS